MCQLVQKSFTCGSCIKSKSHAFIRTLPDIVMIWFFDFVRFSGEEKIELKRFEGEKSIKEIWDNAN